jgi:hypothetical protein
VGVADPPRQPAGADLVDRFALHEKTGVEMGMIPH